MDDDLLENALCLLTALELRVSELEAGAVSAIVGEPPRGRAESPPIRNVVLAHGDCQYAGGGQWVRHWGFDRETIKFPAEKTGDYYFDFRSGHGGAVAHEDETDTDGEVKLAFTLDFPSPGRECVTQWSHYPSYSVVGHVSDPTWRPLHPTDVARQINSPESRNLVFYFHPTWSPRYTHQASRAYFTIRGIPGSGVELESVAEPWVDEDG